MKPKSVITIGAGNPALEAIPEMSMGVQFFDGDISDLSGKYSGGRALSLRGLAWSTHYLLPLVDDDFKNRFRAAFGQDFQDTASQTVELCCIVEDPKAGWSLVWSDNATPWSVEIGTARGMPRSSSDQHRAFLTALAQAFPVQAKAGQIPSPGTPRTLTKQTTTDEGFLRFTFNVPDRRVNSSTGQVNSDTFCSPFRDGQKISSGFEAVGRFALPVPLPYSHLVLLTPPAGTAVEIGTVVPNFGQAGGGVEALFPNGFTNQNLHYHGLPAY